MKNQVSFVNIPTSTLNAIKSLLFSEKEGGVDLSPIVEDLSVGNDCPDLVAVNVALTFRGLKPEIDTNTRYGRDYQSIVEYKFISYSLIRDIVTYQRRTIARWDEKLGDLVPVNDKDCISTTTTDLNCWYCFETDRAIPTAELIKRWKKEDKE